ncbi:MAG: hypothetical protein WBO34_07905 [Gammaproteobacteria bacterium]
MHRNEFAHASHPSGNMVGAISTLIDIRIGVFPNEFIAGAIISFAIDWMIVDLHVRLIHLNGYLQ